MPTQRPAHAARLVIYKSRLSRRNQRWRWRLVAANGRQLANGGEGYTDRVMCLTTARTVLSGAYADVWTMGN